ncbi:hypothetical protein [Rhodoferax sp. GW822-FHT02A01]
MFWKFFSLQKMLDALFDEAWVNLGLPDALDCQDAIPADSL